MRRRRTTALATAIVIGGVLLASPSAAETIAYPTPPTASEQTTITNAMLRPEEVPAVLAVGGGWSFDVMIPQGGQDPFPVCIAGDSRILLSRDGATGYMSRDTNPKFDMITEEVYVYDSPGRAAAAWGSLTRKMQSRCQGTFRDEEYVSRVTSGRIASPVGGAAGWWSRKVAVSGRDNQGNYVTAMPVGSMVSLVEVQNRPGRALTAAQRAAADELTATLAVRLAEAGTLPVTQEPGLTHAQRALLSPSDVPASMQYTTTSQGGWYFSSARTPGTGLLNGRLDRTKGVATFFVDMGDPGVIGDVVLQEVEVYADAAAAQRAWKLLTRENQRAVSEFQRNPTGDTVRMAAGTSALVVAGTPGLWWRSREVIRFGPGEPVANSKEYRISLLLGNAIQSVLYAVAETTPRASNLPLDQLPVNELAEQLALRWMAAAE